MDTFCRRSRTNLQLDEEAGPLLWPACVAHLLESSLLGCPCSCWGSSDPFQLSLYSCAGGPEL